MEYMKNILGTVRKELNRRKGDWPAIAREAGVSYSFVCHVAAGFTNNPKLDTVQKVLDVLYKLDQGKLRL